MTDRRDNDVPILNLEGLFTQPDENLDGIETMCECAGKAADVGILATCIAYERLKDFHILVPQVKNRLVTDLPETVRKHWDSVEYGESLGGPIQTLMREMMLKARDVTEEIIRNEQK